MQMQLVVSLEMNSREAQLISKTRTGNCSHMLAAAQEISLLEGQDVHIHFPVGIVPKDGPSASVTLVTALVSLSSKKRVRADTTMTGEMTLKGLVLPVCGIKDKATVRLVIQRYTREAGVQNLEKNLAALARVAAVRFAKLEQVPLSKDMDRLAPPFLENRLADGAEVEMEVSSPLVVDEDMLEKVLGVGCMVCPLDGPVWIGLPMAPAAMVFRFATGRYTYYIMAV
ncbi:lon protease homolog 2, peroxisomal-like isoform X2 [Euphorbia lathyris]|uniref:lon protease homolog 2, peroxisomal-like isoform X2 n=1 Tax=Euphorbia lathyris TaxID=212925 RepID=UPI00331430F9